MIFLTSYWFVEEYFSQQMYVNVLTTRWRSVILYDFTELSEKFFLVWIAVIVYWSDLIVTRHLCF